MKLSTLALTFTAGLLAAVLPATPAHALLVGPLYTKGFGNSSAQKCYDVAIDDATGRVAITGAFAGTVNFGGGVMTSAGGDDGFIAVFEPDGTFIAQRQFGDTAAQYGMAIAWGPLGELLVGGFFAGTINLGGTNLTGVSGSVDAFFARFDYLLTHIASRRFGDGSAQYLQDLAVDPAGNVTLIGYFQGGIDLGGGTMTSVGSNDVFVAQLTVGFTFRWQQRFGDSASQLGNGVSADAAGNVYVTGQFAGTINFGGSLLTSTGGNDMYIAKFNSAGAHQWSKRFGDASSQIGMRVAATAGGDVYLTGYIAGTIDFGVGVLTSAGASDAVLAKFSTTGLIRWSKIFGNTADQFGMDVDCDDSAVFLTCQAAGQISFGGTTHTSQGDRDVTVAKFDPAGTFEFSAIYGDVSSQYSYGIELGQNRVAMCGSFQGTLSVFGGNIVSAGGEDAFFMVASQQALEPVIRSVTDVGNDQGRRVRVRFMRSSRDDAISTAPVTHYEAYVEGLLPGMVRGMQGGGEPYVYVGSLPASGQTHYTMIVPTFADSNIVDGDYNSRVYLRAATASPTTHSSSSPATGSSVDNLAPGMQDLRFDNGLLWWNPADAPDVDYYSVYGGATASFGNATLIDYTVSPEIDMTGSPRAYYFVTATDFSGNEGEPRMLRRLTGAPDSPATYVLSISAYPNPFNPSTRLRYTLPSRGRVTIDVYDARGGHVARLADGEQDAGAHAVPWDGIDSRGARAGSGVYFARITHPSGTRTYKLVLIK